MTGASDIDDIVFTAPKHSASMLEPRSDFWPPNCRYLELEGSSSRCECALSRCHRVQYERLDLVPRRYPATYFQRGGVIGQESVEIPTQRDLMTFLPGRLFARLLRIASLVLCPLFLIPPSTTDRSKKMVCIPPHNLPVSRAGTVHFPFTPAFAAFHMLRRIPAPEAAPHAAPVLYA